MTKKILRLLLVLLVAMAMNACGGGGTSGTATTSTAGTDAVSSKTYNVKGHVQKGPFINGTSITAYELGDDFKPSGKSFDSQINDNTGNFAISDIALSSQYVRLKADGFYYNEISGDTSSAPLTLYAISDIAGKDTVNVNLLSHLEKDRTEYLLGQGKTFPEAKKQAQKEILNIFSISKDDIKDSETLDISSAGDDNAILLAISVILQGYRTTSELSELLANISTDIRTDGVLDSSSLGSQLINDAKLINLPDIRAHLEGRYKDLGLTASIPNFEKYVTNFIAGTNYVFTKYPQYPENGFYGKNILFGQENVSIPASIGASVTYPGFVPGTMTPLPGDPIYTEGTYYDLAADLPLGTSLKIKITLISGSPWSYNDHSNWDITMWKGYDQTFTAMETGQSCSLRLSVNKGSSFRIDYYENGSTTPTKTKQITVI